MLCKVYTDGLAVLYPEKREKGKFKGLYSSVKKRVAHASAIRRKIFVLTHVLRHRPATFFTVTSAGRPGKISGREIDRLFTLLRNRHGLLSYYWVKEKTKAGDEHLHVVAYFAKDYRMSYWIGPNAAAPAVSLAWSKILGQPPAKNSIRFGWYRGKKRFFYLSKGFGGGYCAKYLSKDRAGSGRKFGRSENLAKSLETITLPVEYRNVNAVEKEVFTVKGFKKAFFYDVVKSVEGLPDWFFSHFRIKRLEDDGFFVDLALLRDKIPSETAQDVIDYCRDNIRDNYVLN